MDGHEAIGPDLDPGLRHLLGEKGDIEILVVVLEEDRLTPIAARGDVMGHIRSDDTGAASHA
jgi:hypothetical protein